jgi:hypothetical protein
MKCLAPGEFIECLGLGSSLRYDEQGTINKQPGKVVPIHYIMMTGLEGINVTTFTGPDNPPVTPRCRG